MSNERKRCRREGTPRFSSVENARRKRSYVTGRERVVHSGGDDRKSHETTGGRRMEKRCDIVVREEEICRVKTVR